MKKTLIAVVVLAVIAAGGLYWLNRPAPVPVPNGGQKTPVAEQRAENAPTAAAHAETESDAAARAEPPPKPKGFCERDFDDVAARKADVADLRAQGGLVHIFEREAQLADPYGCADYYLARGLDIDAADPRDDHEPLTPLFFAIKRNDPKMLRFMIEHGADLEKRAGKNDTRPMGYAYYLALQDQRIDRNEIIGMLDVALTKQAASGSQGGSSSNDTAGE